MSSPKANISFFIPDDENDIQDSMPIQGTNKISIPSEDYYTCYVFGQADFDRIQSIDFYLNGIVGFPMGLLGILNNLIFLGVLTRATMRKSIFNQLLISFAILNILSLTSWIIHLSYKTFHIYTPAYIILFPQFLYPFRSIFLSATVFMTVALVHERWWISAHPNKPNHRYKFAIYILLITMSAIIINMPRFFEMTRVPTTLGHDLIKPSSLRTNPNYSIFYICWTRLVLLKIIPNIVLAILCYKMYLMVRTSQSETTSDHTESLSGEFDTDQERRLSMIFVFIVYAFFVCHIPANFLNLHEAATINKLTYCLQRRSNGLPPWILVLHDISNFFLYLYPCINLWFIFGTRQGYREEYLSLICRRVLPNKGKSRIDGEDQVDDEQRIMDHELTDFDLDRSRNSF